jgi:DNA replication protein DnaC
MNEELLAMLKHLRLNNLIKNYDQYIKLANQKNFSNTKFLNYIVEAEYKVKKENSRKLRILRAHIPEQLAIETFPFKEQPKLNKKKIISIYDSFLYMTKSQNVIWVGNTGCGKTGLATGFLINAINQGCTGRFIQFPELITILHRSIADHSEEKTIKTFATYDCLLIDEIGYVEVEPAQVGLFFTLMHRRHKKKTTLITSNLGFSEWNSFLKNEHLTAALIDRLTENSHVINMKNCVSLRPKLK